MKKFLIISQILYLLFIVPWFVVWGISFMGFDSGFNLLAVAIVTAISLYPLAVIICSIIAWIVRGRRKRVAIIVNLIPMLWVVGIGVPLSIINFS